MDSKIRVPGRDLSAKKVEIILFLILILLGVVRIINAVSISAEYDELWSLYNYVKLTVPEIFRDVATPNNHVLNTLGMKLFTSGGKNLSMLTMRLPSILSFLGLGTVLILACVRYLKSIYMQFACVLAVLLSGLILHYGEVARGYMMQTFFVTGLFFALVLLLKENISVRTRVWGSALWLLCSVLCCLSVSSGVIFVTIVTFVLKICSIFPLRETWRSFFEKEKYFLAGGVLFVLFVLLYYGSNYAAFAQGRAQFGEVFTSGRAFIKYGWDILMQSHLFYGLLVTVPGCFFLKGLERKLALTASFAVIFTLLSALVTKGGPVRVYTGLIPMTGFCAFVCLEAFLEKLPRRKKECMLGVALVLSCLSVFTAEERRLHFADPDLGVAFDRISREIPQNLVVIYRPTDAYVIARIAGNSARIDFAKRLIAPDGILLLHDPFVGGMRLPDFATRALIPHEKAHRQWEVGRGLSLYYYPLRKLHRGDDLKNRIVFCFVRGSVEELRTQENTLKKHFISINGFLNPVRGMMPYYLFAADGNALSAEELISWENAREGMLDFRILGK